MMKYLEQSDPGLILELLKLEDNLLMPEMPDELLYGRVGYLYALLYVRKASKGLKTFPDHEELEKTIVRVIEMIIKSGKDGSKR